MIGRNRFVKPETFTHGLLFDTERALNTAVLRAWATRLPAAVTVDTIVDAPPPYYPVRLAYIGLWCMSDREGRFEWKPRELKTSLLPYDDGVDFARILDALRAAGFIAPYTVAGRAYGWVPRFTHHQYVNPQERASALPAPPIDVVRTWQRSQLAGMMATERAEQPELLNDSVTPAWHDPASFTVAESSLTESGNFADVPSEFGPAAAAVETKVGDAESVTSGNGNDLRDGQRVGLASATHEERDGGACITEQNRTRTEQNYTTRTTAVALVADARGARALPRIIGKPTGAAIIARLGTVLDEVRTGARTRFSAEQTRKLQAGTVFAYWMAKFGHERALLDDKRERVIMRRLEENGGDVSELLHALDGARGDSWVMGTAPRADHKNDSVGYIFADRERVERFASTRKKYRDGVPHELATKYAAIIRDCDPAMAQLDVQHELDEAAEVTARAGHERAGPASAAPGGEHEQAHAHHVSPAGETATHERTH